MENLGEIVRRLHAAKVEFVLVGGLAAVRHGSSYVTYHVDICVPLEIENFRRTEAIGRPQDMIVVAQLRAIQEQFKKHKG